MMMMMAETTEEMTTEAVRAVPPTTETRAAEAVMVAARPTAVLRAEEAVMVAARPTAVPPMAETQAEATPVLQAEIRILTGRLT